MARESQLERLDKSACIKRYLEADVRHKSVLLVAANISMNDRLSWVPSNTKSSLHYRFESIPTGSRWVWEMNWLCSAFWASTFPGSPEVHRWCSEEFLLSRAEDWTMQFLEVNTNQQVQKRLFAKVDYCLSAGAVQDADGCAIRYSLIVLLAVTGVNACVLTCVYFTWNIHRARTKEIARGKWEEEQLTTLDEAVSSFLQHEDQHITNATFLEFSSCNDSVDFRTLNTATQSCPAVHQLQSNLRWYSGAGRLLWYTTTFVFVGWIAALSFLVARSSIALQDYSLPTDLSSLWREGVGETHAYAITLTKAIESFGVNAFYGTLLLANVPQILLGIAWWLANSLLTRLLLARRWARFIVKRSGLQVSSPKGQQRSSYILSLPYRYSIPLMIASALLHWLLSQAIFAVQTRGFAYDLQSRSKDQFVRDEGLDGSVLGYSTIAAILALSILLAISVSIASLAMKPLPSRKVQPGEDNAERLVTRMPLVLGCSAAISAACHPSPRSQEAHLDRLQWGKMATGKWSITNETPLRYSLDAFIRTPAR
ncbi:hypothetical protein GGR58DRAFT_507215 [Xylaria digitata]|nr:hypothetical protein GGR58DRAFT_507215 [Xylaria digitata]